MVVVTSLGPPEEGVRLKVENVATYINRKQLGLLIILSETENNNYPKNPSEIQLKCLNSLTKFNRIKMIPESKSNCLYWSCSVNNVILCQEWELSTSRRRACPGLVSRARASVWSILTLLCTRCLETWLSSTRNACIWWSTWDWWMRRGLPCQHQPPVKLGQTARMRWQKYFYLLQYSTRVIWYIGPQYLQLF